MREYRLEVLDKMFPRGYIIVCLQESGDLSAGFWNPEQHMGLAGLFGVLTAEGTKDGEESQ